MLRTTEGCDCHALPLAEAWDCHALPAAEGWDCHALPAAEVWDGTPYRRQRDGIATPYLPIAKPIVQGLPYCILWDWKSLRAMSLAVGKIGN